MVLNPKCDIEERQNWTSALKSWSKLDICPLEDPDHRHQSLTSSSSRRTHRNQPAEAAGEAVEAAEAETEEDPEDVEKSHPAVISSPQEISYSRGGSRSTKSKRRSRRPRTIFHMALDALHVEWTDPSLKTILTHDQGAGLLWAEHVPTACARIDALKTHGYNEEALRLALAVARTLQHNQNVAHAHWQQNQDNYSSSMQWSVSGVARKPAFACPQGWIGHALNPVGCLFNTLVEPCILPDDKPRLGCHLDLAATSETGEGTPPPTISTTSLKYYHQPLSADDSFMVLAVESTLIALGQQRLMPAGLYAQEKALKQEQRLLTKLQELDLDPILLKVHARQAQIQLEMGPTSGLGWGIHPESIPMQTYAKYLFHTLLPHDFDLAFKVGLRALRMPVLDEAEKEELPALAAAVAAAAVAHQPAGGDEGEAANGAADPGQPQQPPPSSYVMNRLPRWFTIGHIESQQCSLASRMLNAAKGNNKHANLELFRVFKLKL